MGSAVSFGVGLAFGLLAGATVAVGWAAYTVLEKYD